jgi:hypothetical protein
VDEKFLVTLEIEGDGGGREGALRNWALNLANTLPVGLLATGYDVEDRSPRPVVGPITSTMSDGESEGGVELTPAIVKFILLDRERQVHKEFFEAYRLAVEELVKEQGEKFHFQDEQGVVYRVTVPSGTFVTFDRYKVERTRRKDEKKGSMSMEDGRRLGYVVEGK